MAATASQPEIIEEDPRENEEWFLALPDSAKQKFRAEWEAEARLNEIHERQRSSYMLQEMAEFTALILGVRMLVMGVTWPSAIACIVVGAGVGFASHHGRLDRGPAAALAVMGFCLVALVFGAGNIIALIIGIMFVLPFAMALGFSHESWHIGQ